MERRGDEIYTIGEPFLLVNLFLMKARSNVIVSKYFDVF